MTKLRLLLCALLFSGIPIAHAQYTDMYDFNGTNGGNPEYGALTLSGTVLYGMTNEFTVGTGNIFSINTDGSSYADIFDFGNVVNGENPYGSLTFSGGVLYGMTSDGGSTYPYGDGNIFGINTNGTGYTKLYHFTNLTAGSTPNGSLTQSGNVFYGMTLEGGANGIGNIFSVNTDGSGYVDMYDFTNASGCSPYGTTLVLSGNVLYGMTFKGGANGDGDIFSINTNGTGFTDMLDFNGTNGASPYGSLTLSGNVLYGMTAVGGPSYNGNIFSININGTGYTDLFDFNGVNGQGPEGSLTLVGNVLYGMTVYGGASSDGNIFSINTNGTGFTDLFDFSGSNGKQPEGSLTVSGNTLYGMTYAGGASGYGVIFSFKVNGLGLEKVTSTEGMLNVYPNPSNGKFTLAFSHPELVSGSQTITIYNDLGEQVYDGMPKQIQHNNSIDLSTQPDGIYLYRVISDNGNLLGEGKVIIQK